MALAQPGLSETEHHSITCTPMSGITRHDLALGAFTDNGPWDVDPDAMAWRTDVDRLRAQAAAQVPEMIKPRKLPPRRGATIALKLVASAGPWVVRNRKRLDNPAAQTELASMLRPVFES